jgi:hypothetical protein
MQLRNDFTTETKDLFAWCYQCFWCGQNGWDCFHHILGRVSNSPLNACPIHNMKCHIHNGELSKFSTEKMLLKRTLEYLLENNYELTQQDIDFMKSYSTHYDDFQHLFSV